MNRKKPPVELSLLLDGRLAPEQESEWRDRIEADPALRSGFASFRSTTEMLRAGSTISELPPGFDARLKARLRTEELTSRARRQARRTPEVESWSQRVAVGLGGLAAGVAIMLAFGPTPGVDEPLEYGFGGRNLTGVVLPGSVPESARLSPSEIQAIANQRARALEQLGRTLRSAGTYVSPNVLRAEMQLTGLRDQSQGLLANAQAHRSALGEDTVRFLGAVEAVCEDLEAMIQNAEAVNGRVSGHEAANLVNSALANASAIPAPEVRNFQVGSRNFSELSELAAPASEAEAYAETFRAFNQEEYWFTAGLARQFLETWPNSEWAGTVCRFGAISLHRMGDASAALRLVDTVSQRRMTVLNAFNPEDLSAMRASAMGRPSGIVNVASQAQNVAPLFNAVANQVSNLLSETSGAEVSYRNIESRMQVLRQLESAQATVDQYRNSQLPASDHGSVHLAGDAPESQRYFSQELLEQMNQLFQQQHRDALARARQEQERRNQRLRQYGLGGQAGSPTQAGE